MENNLNSQFNKLKESVHLTPAEKEFHKSQILKFMEKGAKHAVPSPFQFHFFPRAKMLTAGVAFFLFLGTGLVSSAKSSLPNEYLYVFRIKVVEPVQVFMARGVKNKNDTRIALIANRLKDFSKVNLKNKLSPKEEELFATSFSMNIKEVQKEITKQAEEEDVSEALSAANDLQSVLSAHSVVIDKIKESGNSGEKKMELKDMMIAVSQANDLSTNINESMDTTKEIIGDLTSKLQDSEETDELENALNKQKEELSKTLEEVKKLVKNATDKGSLDSEDEAYITEKLSEIEKLIAEGDEKKERGSKKAALNIYNGANQEIGELRNLLGTEQELHIDVLGGSEVNGEITNEIGGQ